MPNRKQRRTAESQARHAPPEDDYKIICDCSDRNVLAKIGALVPGVWSVPSTVRLFLESKGLPVPAPVQGAFLVDTGADLTCIGVDVAQQLGLVKTDEKDGFGAGGRHKNPIYSAKLTIPIRNSQRTITLDSERPVRGVPNLDQFMVNKKALDGQGRPVRLIGLLGREFLRLTTMSYRGFDGRVEIRLDRNAIKELQQTQTPT